MSPEELAEAHAHSMEPTDECAIHGYEPIPPTYYRICPECWHVFVTSEELLKAHNEILAELLMSPETDVEQVFICPVCTHDF